MDYGEVTIMVDVKGRVGEGANKEQDVLKVPYHLLWEDLRLMLMLTFDCLDVKVKYVDEEGDEIAVNCQDELFLAFMMAKCNNDILYLKVDCLMEEDCCNTQENDVVVEFRDDIPPTRVRSPFTILTPSAPEVANCDESDSLSPPEGISNSKAIGTVVADSGSPRESSESPSTDSGSICLEPKSKIVADPNSEVAETVSQVSTEDSSRMDFAYDEDVGTPPPWFCTSLAKFKREMVDDISQAVCQRTVKNILKGLDGAVITSVQKNGTASPSVSTATSTADVSNSTTPTYHHPGIICDHCETAIVGIRYKCGNCPDFDLCETCEAIEGVHNQDHVFLKLRRPTHANRIKNGQIVPLLRQSLYEPTENNQRWIDKMKNFEAKMQRKVEKEMRKLEKKEEKQQKREERRSKVMERRDERLKRKCERANSTSQKRERLDLPQFKKKPQSYEGYFAGDVTVTDGTVFTPGTQFTKMWAMQNCGEYAWEEGTKLRMLYGNLIPVDCEVDVEPVGPSETAILQVEFVAPQEPGTYRSDWRLHSPSGKWFGHRIWCKIVVDLTPEEITKTVEVQNTEKVQNVEEMRNAEEVIDVQENQKEPEEESAETAETAETQQSEDKPVEKMDEVDEADNSMPLPLSEYDSSEPKEPNSPVTTLGQAMQRLSTSSSSLELLDMVSPQEEVSPSSESHVATTTPSLVTERMQALKPAMSVDFSTASLDSTTIDWSDSDSDSDFYVVPIPDCFNPNLPMTTSTSTSVIVPRDDVNKCLGMNSMETTSMSSRDTLVSGSDDVVIVNNNTQMESFESVDQGKSAEQADNTEVEDESIMNVDENAEAPAPQMAEESQNDTERSEMEVADQQNAEAADQAESVQEKIHKEQEKVLQEHEKIRHEHEKIRREHEETHVKQQEALKGKESEMTEVLKAHRDAVKDMQDQSYKALEEHARILKEHEELCKKQEEDPKEQDQPQKKNQSAPIEIPVRHEQSSPTSERPRSSSGHNISTSPTQVASTVFSTALGVAGQAAASAYSTARDVFHTLQARNKYVHKTSSWTPPASTWTPAPDTFTYPTQTATPSVPRVLTPMDQLIEMGFANRDLNRELLEKHNNDVEAVVMEILQHADNDWHQKRH